MSPLDPELPPVGEEVHLPGPSLLPLLTDSQYTNAVAQPDHYRTPKPAQTVTYELIHVKPSAHSPGITNLFRFEELTDQIATAIFTAGRDMGMTAWTSAQTGVDFHIGRILNEAWDSFFCEPATFAAYEKQQINSIRTRLSQPSH